jgi:transaldolase
MEKETKTSYEELKKYTIVSADTGDVELVKKLKPQDATTNPTLVLKSFDAYVDLFNDAVEYSIKKLNSQDSTNQNLLNLIYMKFCVNIGANILKHIEGVISTEVDARISYNKDESIERARTIIALYKELDIPKERVLIKLSATWEGIQAAEVLEKEGIRTNLTLVFHIIQAVACAERGITLISPFVGRVNDSYIKKTGLTYSFENEPGVILVKNIFNYFKKFDHKTIIMGASLRTTGSCYELSGCDKLTIPPNVLELMQSETTPVEKKLIVEEAKKLSLEKIDTSDENEFKSELSKDEIARDLLKNGIDAFIKDVEKVEELIVKKLVGLNQ